MKDNRSMDNTRYLDQLTLIAGDNIEERDFWLDRLAGDWVKSRFPFDHDTSEPVKDEVEVVEFSFPPALSAKAKQLSKGSDVRLNIILAAGITALLHRYTGSSDMITGMPIYKQESEREFINTLLVLRNRLEESVTFKELILQTRQTLLDALEHQNYPLEVLAHLLDLPAPEKGSPFFDVLVMLENIHDREYVGHMRVPMTFCFLSMENSLHGSVEYDPSLYRKTTVQRIIRHFTTLLEGALANIDLRLREIDIMSEEEQQQILEEFNGGFSEYAAEDTLHGLFERQAAKTPGNIAAVGVRRGKDSLEKYSEVTFGQLNEMSNRLALDLREKGVTVDTIVGIRSPRSIDMLAGLLGILKAGGAYMPIDPQYPDDRVQYMMKDSGASILLAAGEENLPAAKSPPGRGAPKGRGGLAYIIYTSGTTGIPKGVMVEHRSAAAYLHAFYREFPVEANDVVLQMASYCFDVFTEEVYPVLLKGGKIVIASDDDAADFNALVHLIRDYKVTIVDSTPMLLQEFNKLVPTGAAGSIAHPLSSVHTFISGGDTLKKDHIANLLKTAKVYNTYGPTETTVCASYYRCTENTGPDVPIGKPIANYNVYILDPLNINKLQPIGTAGELCITGPGLTRGYLNRPELTYNSFCLRRAGGSFEKPPPAPPQNFYLKFLRGVQGGGFFKMSPPARRRLYKTGDLCRWLWDGGIQFLGRVDRQVKIRGFRIELGEIEGRLVGYERVSEAVVVGREDVDGDKYLCAYIVPGKGVGDVDIVELRDGLARFLPHYMIPQYFVLLEKLPLTANGKLDRRNLPPPQRGRGSGTGTPPRNRTEEMLLDIWSEVLGLEGDAAVGIDDNFFQLGGHSLKAITMTARVHKLLDIKIPLAEVFKTPTVRGLAAYIAGAGADEYVSIEPVEEKEYYEVSYNQKRLWIINQLEPGGQSYHLPGDIRLETKLEEEIIEEVLYKLMERHESFCTGFRTVGGEVVQFIGKNIKIPFKKVDISSLPVEEKERKRRQYIGETGSIPFDLGRPPLFRAMLLKLNQGEYELLYNMHHIISDAWSMEIMKRDIILLYEECKSQDVEAEPLKIRYRDFAGWQNRRLNKPELKEKAHEYWLHDVLDGLPANTLPRDFNRSFDPLEGALCGVMIRRGVRDRLVSIAGAVGASLSMVIFSVLNMLIFWITGDTEVVCGIISAGRDHADLENVVGFFVNTLLAKNVVDYEKTFSDFLREVGVNTVRALQHQSYPLETVLDDLDMKFPDIPVSFNMLNVTEGAAGEIKEEDFAGPRHVDRAGYVKFDLSFHVMEYQGGFEIGCLYRKRLFEKQRIQHMMQHYLELLNEIADDPGKKMIDYFPGGTKKRRKLNLG